MPDAEQARAEREYYAAYPWTDPAHNVARIAGRHIRDRARKHFTGRLLEIGCGEKAKAALVGDLADEHIGLDHEDSPHEQSRVDVFGSADDIPLPAGSFVCLLSKAVLEHLEESQTALQEAHRFLRSGGVALYTAPLYWHIHEAPWDFFRYTSYGLHHLFGRAGFEVLEVTPLSGFWTTFGTEMGYYLQKFRWGPLRLIVDSFVALLNLLMRWIVRGPLRDERFTWMYLVVVRKPEPAAPAAGELP